MRIRWNLLPTFILMNFVYCFTTEFITGVRFMVLLCALCPGELLRLQRCNLIEFHARGCSFIRCADPPTELPLLSHLVQFIRYFIATYTLERLVELGLAVVVQVLRDSPVDVRVVKI